MDVMDNILTILDDHSDDSDDDYEDEGESEASNDNEDDRLSDVSESTKNPWAVSQEFTAEIYPRGYRFPEYLSYQELYLAVNYKHQVEGGGEPLKTRAFYKTPEDLLPYQIHFYCSHSRDHVSENKCCEAKVPKNADATRASRAQEDRRSSYTKCKYSITVRLDRTHIVQTYEGFDAQTNVRGLKSKVKGRWFVDSHEDFKADIKRRNFMSSCFSHSGHCKHNLVLGQITPEIRQFIHDSARSCVPIASICSQIFAAHNTYLTYQQVWYEVCMGCDDVRVAKGGVTSKSGNRMNPCESLLDWLRNEEDHTWCLLVENLDESTEKNIQFETWHGDSNLNTEVCSKKEEFAQNSCLKAKESRSGADQQIHHGRLYDTSRFIKLPDSAAVYFLVAVCWVTKDESRVCAAYPEVLVVDSKANTNKLRHAFFCAVGVDGNNNNAILFRAWLPNNTEDSYSWLFNTAIKLLFKPSFLAQVRFVMSDNCHTMGPVLEDACQIGESFSNAMSFICVYHIERNFFQEFGIASRGRWRLKPSSMQKKKGGKIDWAYGWQKQCVKAIYTLQKCESVAEINECKRWIASFISAAPDMDADLKRAVRMFFQRKYALRTQWVLAFRIRRRGFNVAASSRVEGEFGVLNKLNMSSSLNFRTGITKMRYSASSRHLKKRYRAERWSSSTVIRDAGSCGMSSREFRILDDKLTPFYVKSVEQQVTAAQKFLKAQLIQMNGNTELIFRVWSPTAHGDDDHSASDASDSDNGSNDDDEEVLQAPLAIVSPAEHDHPDFDDPNAEQFSEIRTTNPSTISENFNWLRVRTVVLNYIDEKNAWEMRCSCCLLERTCTPCRHIFCVTKTVQKNYGIKALKFNRRCYKGFYYHVMCTADDISVSDGDADVIPALHKKIVDDWLATNPVPSDENVPNEGLFGAHDSIGYDDDHCLDHMEGAAEARRVDNKKRRTANAASIQEQVHNVISLLGPVSCNATGYNDFSDYIKTYSDTLSRTRRQSAPGAGKQNRIIGTADLGTGSRPAHASHHSALPRPSRLEASVAAHPALQTPIELETAAQVLQRSISIRGVKDGNYVEVFTCPGTPPTDRWFLKVVDGSVVGRTPNLCLKACAWCATNSLKLDPEHTHIVQTEIRTILSEGPAEQFQVAGGNGSVLPKVLKVLPVPVTVSNKKTAKAMSAPPLPPTSAVPAAARAAVHTHCVISSDSDEDAPISKDVNLAASKRKAVYAPLCCTGTPKNHSLCACAFCAPPPPCKKPTAVLGKRSAAKQPCTDSTCCTCDGSLTCDYCQQFAI